MVRKVALICNDYGSYGLQAFKQVNSNTKSIVKTVDADNLPSGEVLAISKSEIHCGQFGVVPKWFICEIMKVYVLRMSRTT